MYSVIKQQPAVCPHNAPTLTESLMTQQQRDYVKPHEAGISHKLFAAVCPVPSFGHVARVIYLTHHCVVHFSATRHTEVRFVYRTGLHQLSCGDNVHKQVGFFGR